MKATTMIMLGLTALIDSSSSFTTHSRVPTTSIATKPLTSSTPLQQRASPPSHLKAADLDTVALVVGQETYGLAAVAVGEALWSFLAAPSMSHAKVLIPAGVGAAVLVAVSGPLVTSGDASSVTLGLEIAAAVSALLGASYVARMVAPFSPSAKEIAFLGLLFSIAGFFSFSQNLVVDGFITLPNLPSLPFPELELGLGENIDVSTGM